MNDHGNEAQARLQELAEQAERLKLAAGDPELDAHRLVLRALRRPLALQLPANFAARVAARVAAAEGAHRLEDWLLNGLMLALAITGAFYLRPVLAIAAEQLQLDIPSLNSLPGPLLAAAAASLLVAWVVDRGAAGWSRNHGLH